MAALDSSTPLNSAAAIGVEMEKLKDNVYAQFNQDDLFMTRIATKKNDAMGNPLMVSARLCRIPILAQPGAPFAQFVPDGTGDSMGVGGGSVYDEGVCTPVYFVQACQVTKEAEWATNGEEKALVNVFKEEFKTNMKEFRTNLDGLCASSSGAGDIATVTVTPSASNAQNYLNVSNANNLRAGSQYQILASIGGSNRGNIQILTADLANNIVYLITINGYYYPQGTTTGDVIIVSGASGAATASYSPDRYTTATIAASLNGVPAINLSSSTGSWFGIPRTTYPGVLNAEYVNGASTALVPQQIMLLQSLVQRANGTDAEEMDDFVLTCNVDIITSWESLGLFSWDNPAAAGPGGGGYTNVSHTVQDGEKRMDYLAKKRTKTIAGYEVIANIKARQQRLDFLGLKYWFRIETKPTALYDVDGVTVFPLYGSDGGVAPTSAFYFVTGLQMANNRPRSGAYIDTLALPAGF
jgi:hypothetical protein